MDKKSTAIAAGILCIISVASAQSVISGTFGFVKVDAPAGDFKMIGPAFDVGDDGTITVDEMIGTNGFHANFSKDDADRVYIWDAVNLKYEAAFLNDDAWGATNPQTLEEIAYKWCYFDDAVSSYPLPCAGSSKYELKSGDSLYVRVKNEVEVVLSGNVPTASTTTVTIVEGFNMLSNPYPGDTALKDIISVSDGAYASYSKDKADRIYVWDNGKYDSYFLNDDTWGATNPQTLEEIAYKWCYFDDAISSYPLPASKKIAAGLGFYYSRGLHGLLEWDKARPFSID